MQRVTNWIRQESAPGVVLMLMALAGLIVANSPLQADYFGILHSHLLGLSIEEWVNDGLMALFFTTVGLEVKRELFIGQLNRWPLRIMPGLAAMGGVLVPALLYVAINHDHPKALRGWAIPTATDIAFALAVFALAGPRVPASLKVLLTAIAVIDDLIAVVVIACFYTAQLHFVYLAAAVLPLLALMVLNRLRIARMLPYMLLGIVLWWLVLQSGIHATLAGVVLAMTIPLTGAAGATPKNTRRQVTAEAEYGPLETLEHGLSPWVGFVIIPLFGFANAGVPLSGLTLNMLAEPVLLGIALALFVGKQVGIFATIRLLDWLKIAPRPDGANWWQVYALSVVCGVGFTMSLFVNLLAFDHPELIQQAKLGILAGSLVSGIAGWLLLRITSRTTIPVKGEQVPADEQSA